ncbi:MAG: Gfo/Idh/MocA family oxidoreductase [Verrucomicrobia bacterium]|nr:Gfo/Idh/MocA family oxidoreductase [Verrucomicrobiota bacterium]
MDNNETKSSSGPESRREFIKKTATAAAAVVATANVFKTPVYGQNQAPSAGRVVGANDRIAVAYIGVGGQGQAHVDSMKRNASDNNIVQAAVCDVSKTRNGEAKKMIGNSDVAEFEDYRKLLERKDIDAVCIATVDHWHTKTSIDALNAGKNVYVEKPMTRYLGEAFDLHDTVKKTGKILQVGSQGCSDAKYHKAADLIKAGKIGPLVMSQGSYMRNNPKGEWNNYEIFPWVTPQDINWEMWQGSVHKKVSFNGDYFRRWRKYYPYCAGLLGDLVPHRLHPLILATGNPEFPVRVNCIGTRKIHSDLLTPGTPERDVPESVQLLAEFPSGLTLIVASSSVNEQGFPDIIRGHKATLYFGGNRLELKPERPFADEIDPESFDNLTPGEDIGEHEKNWFSCIRTGKLPHANIDLAVRVQTIISLAEMSDRLGITCLFDEKTRKISTGDGRPVEPLSYHSVEALNYGKLPLS